MSNQMPEQAPKFIKNWASAITARRLTVPAIFLLEANKPFSFAAGQFLLLGQPLLESFLPGNVTAQAIDLFNDRRHVDALIAELEKES